MVQKLKKPGKPGKENKVQEVVIRGRKVHEFMKKLLRDSTSIKKS